MKTVQQLSAQDAACKVKSGDVLVVGGFGMTGVPVHLLDAITETNIKNLILRSKPHLKVMIFVFIKLGIANRILGL